MDFPESFLPARIARAADHAMHAVLEEDAALREAGLSPTTALRFGYKAGRAGRKGPR